MKNDISKKEGICFIVALLFALIIQGSVPLISMPTLGQAIWTTGFSQSFLNDSVFSFYAHNFGAPKPAPIAFGLAGAWIVTLFLKLGLHPADAYSAMVAFWMTIAFSSSYLIARYFSVHRLLSILAALCWLTMPIIWAHAGYSMVSIGIALLPLYFLTAFNVLMPKNKIHTSPKGWFLIYPFVCIISVFMDGYSFMMFAVGSSILGGCLFFCCRKYRKYYLLFAFPVHIFSFGFAYFLYAIYVGKTQFEPAPIDFFRGWGVDLSFLVIPTKGMHWFADFIGWSVERSGNTFFGDSSVWVTTFSVPIIVGAIWAMLKISNRKGVFISLLFMTLFGFYMSMGPSLKYFSVKPAGEEIGPMMAKEHGIAPTGSALLSNNVPGFKNMRASYRWMALGVFGAWVILISAMAKRKNNKMAFGAAIIVSAVTFLNFPNIPDKFSNNLNHRKMFMRVESELVGDFNEVVISGETVAFLPWRNDFLVNYIAARTSIVAFNVGGDKNLSEARKNWPTTMRRFPMGKVDVNFINRTILLFARNEADAVILPYIDMLYAAHSWPHKIQFKESLYPVVEKLKGLGLFRIEERTFYTIVRLKPEFSKKAKEGILEKEINRKLCLPPVCIKATRFDKSTNTQVGTVQDGRVLSDGRAGFLHFGPYNPMDAGEYKLIVRGIGTATSSSFVDVVSDKGRVIHSKILLNQKQQGNSVLVEGTITLPQPVGDLEIRLFVYESDVIVIDGYELTPLD